MLNTPVAGEILLTMRLSVRRHWICHASDSQKKTQNATNLLERK